jgi:hypothetical protein
VLCCAVLCNIEALKESKQHLCHSGGYSSLGSYLVPFERNSRVSYSGNDVFKYRLVFGHSEYIRSFPITSCRIAQLTYGHTLTFFVSSLQHKDINILRPTCYVTHRQFNIQQFYILPTLYLCVLYFSQNKQRLLPRTT